MYTFLHFKIMHLCFGAVDSIETPAYMLLLALCK